MESSTDFRLVQCAQVMHSSPKQFPMITLTRNDGSTSNSDSVIVPTGINSEPSDHNKNNYVNLHF